MGSHAYPPELARYVTALWPAESPLEISPKLLEAALSAAFQASLTSEEARPTRFRLLLTPVDRLPESGAPNDGVLRLRFEESRPLQPDEIRRLAPAVPFETALIGAQVEGDALRIWGVAHSGPAWLAPTWGGRSLVPNWTHDPIIHAAGPGQIAVRCAGKLVGAIERGILVDAMMDVFESHWLPAMFAREREEIRALHAVRQSASPSPTDAEHSLVGRIGQHMLRRAIRVVRSAQHGGMFLFVDTDGDPTSLDGVRLKYRARQDEPARRYRSLLLRILDFVANATSKTSVGWDDFMTNASGELAELEQAVFEWSRVIANFAAIDGAVVVDKRMGLLGFGAEVSGDMASPPQVLRALDLEGVERTPEPIDGVGTRHRAAYRFIHAHPSSLAIVISHDGGVSFVANRGGDVVIWEQSVSP